MTNAVNLMQAASRIMAGDALRGWPVPPTCVGFEVDSRRNIGVSSNGRPRFVLSRIPRVYRAFCDIFEVEWICRHEQGGCCEVVVTSMWVTGGTLQVM